MPRVLRTLCATGCADITPDPVADIAALVQRMRTRASSTARWCRRRDGAHRPASAACGCSTSSSRATSTPPCGPHFPGAVRSALNGDTAPLLRLALRADRGSRARRRSEFFSDALFAATVCEEGPLPLARARRRPAARLRRPPKPRLARYPSTALTPFDRTTALFASATVQLCSRWPSAPAEPAIQDGPFPAVPALVLSGEDDLRTPLESARRIAARIPGATLVSGAGDGPLRARAGSRATCGLRAADDFFSGRPLRRCPPRRREFPPVPDRTRARCRRCRPSRALRGRPGRTLSAVALTLVDALDQVFSAALLASPDQDVIHVGGLRAGFARAGVRTFGVPQASQYVPGVRLTAHCRVTRPARRTARVAGEPRRTAGSCSAATARSGGSAAGACRSRGLPRSELGDPVALIARRRATRAAGPGSPAAAVAD